MTDDKFSFSALIAHITDWVRSVYRHGSFRLMEGIRKAMNVALRGVLLLIFVPLILMLLAISLGFGFKSWLDTSFAIGFLMAAAALLVLFFVVLLIGHAVLVSRQAKMLGEFLDKMGGKASDEEDNIEKKPLTALLERESFESDLDESNSGISPDERAQ